MGEYGEFTRAFIDLYRSEGMRHVVEAKPNYWDVLGHTTGYENLYSRFLAWLLDPKESHGMTDAAFATRVLMLAGWQGDVDPSSITVHREWNRIDLLLVEHTHRVCVAIENKTQSEEHYRNGAFDVEVCDGSEVRRPISQLDFYYRFLSGEAFPVPPRRNSKAPSPKEKHSDARYKDYLRPTVRHLYLTKDGSEPPLATTHADKWRPTSYIELEPALLGVIHSAGARGDDHTKKLVEDFYFDQKRKFDTSLRLAARALYEAHRVEVAGLAQHFDLGGGERRSSMPPEDADRLATSLSGMIETLTPGRGRTHLERAVAAVWDARTEHTNDLSRYSWTGIDRHLNKHETLCLIAAAFREERHATPDALQAELNVIVRDVLDASQTGQAELVLQPLAGISERDTAPICGPDSPHRSAAVLVFDTEYQVRWHIKNVPHVGRAQRRLIEHFMESFPSDRYPITRVA